MLAQALHHVLQRIDNAARAAQRPVPRLLVVSKTHAAAKVDRLASALSAHQPAQAPAFGENYVQEAAAKVVELTQRGIEWHLIGHLQSNKAAHASALFDWVQTVDRDKLVTLLARHRPPARGTLNVLVQVNIDDEAGKHGCAPAEVEALAALIAEQPQLVLRGLMAIPAPDPNPARRRGAFRSMRRLYERLQQSHAGIDTLSMGMSDDLELAIAEGATMVRVGTAVFGSREPGTGTRES